MTTVETDSAPASWRAWRAEREDQLRRPHDWLSVVAYHWVPRSEQPLPGLPGTWWADEDRLHVRVSAAEGARLPGEEGEPGDVLDGTASAAVGEAGSVRFLLTRDEVLVEVVRRAGLYAVRVRDPRAATRTAFTGVPTYDYDPAWVLDVVTEPYAAPRPTPVGAAAPGLTQVASAVGEVVLTHDGVQHRLVAVGTGERWTLLFSDETSGRTSSAWRVVPLSGDPASGRATLDLNRATNLPYAFTDYGTCPRPVEGNHLPFAVTAGERAPEGRTGVPGQDVPTRVPAEQPA